MSFLLKAPAVLIVAGFLLPWVQTAAAQEEPSALQLHKTESAQRKTDLELQKLELEIAKLKKEADDWPMWVSPLFAFVAAIVGTTATFLIARRTRENAVDQATHEKRLECYPQFVKATSRLAIYFPEDAFRQTASLTQDECRTMGRAMSEWYFERGGLLLSVTARDAYFKLARALTRASQLRDKELNVPKFPDDALDISKEKIDKLQSELEKAGFNLEDIENWPFGDSSPKASGPGSFRHLRAVLAMLVRRKNRAASGGSSYLEFKDYVFLRRLSSKLRTELSEDVRGRRPPS